MSDLTTRLGPLTLPNPVLVAAGCGGTGRELARFTDLAALGALVTPSVTATARAGGRSPRVAETPSGLLRAEGLPGPGVETFVEQDLPWLAGHGVRTIVSVAGGHSDEYAAVVRRLAGQRAVAALEVRLGTLDAVGAARVVGVVRRAADPALPVFAKLAADVGDIAHVARVCADAGCDGFTLVDGPAGLAIDVDTLAPSIAATTGLLSGPAIRPVALRCVWQVRRAVRHLPIIGCGGVTSGLEALAFLAAGASAVALGTATLADPTAPARVRDELAAALSERGFATVQDVVGLAHRDARAVAAAS